MAALTRKNLFTAAGLLVIGIVARRARQFYLETQEAAPSPRLRSSPNIAPVAGDAKDEHLHVSLGEFIPGGQLNVR